MARATYRILPILLACLSGCAGYQVGTESLYPPHIRTVYVPMFESVSFRRNQGERLTEAVCKQIEAKTPYKVVHTPDADSVLFGRIIGDTKHVVVGGRRGDTREAEIKVQVEVSWVDRNGDALRQAAPIPVSPAVVSISSSATFIPEVGQSTTTAGQQAIEDLAEEIVSMMEAPW